MKMKNTYIIGFILLFTSIGADLFAQNDYKLAEQDSLALVAFYWATDGPNWLSNQEGFSKADLSTEWQDTYDGQFNNWFDGPAKDWFGVKVQKRPIPNSTDSTYRVTWLWPVIGRRTDGQNMLSGYVPREMGLMTALEQFRVNGNDGFTNELIPDELYHRSLRHFDTESAWFGGGLSDAFRNCVNIRKMNVRYNNYDHMPNIDFIGEEGARNLEGTQWFYNSRFSYFYMERIVDFFYSISDNPMEFGLEARDMFDVGDEEEIVAPVGSSIEMICNDAGMREEFITYQWFKDGLSKFGKNKKTYDIASVKESDYGHYTTRITNDYVKSYDSNGNYGEVFTKGIHVVPAPVAPVIYKAVVDNSGQYLDLYFSKRMTGATGFENLQITADGEAIQVVEGMVKGRINREARVFLETPIQIGSEVILSYDSDAIIDKNGGVMEVISDFQVENRARMAPSIDSARTTLDGSGILVYFDYFINPNSLTGGDFEIEGSTAHNIASVSLVAGDIDLGISKTVLLTLAEEVSDSAEVLTLNYMGGGVHGLYGGTLQPVSDIPVDNIVTVDRTEVVINFEDGSGNLSDVVIKGSWRAIPIQLFDDGTNGDLIPSDNTWTTTLALADDEYGWDVFARETVATLDTVYSTDSLGNTVLTLIPSSINKDSLLNNDYILEFSVGDRRVVGDTIFGIFNRDVVFNLTVNAQGEDIYLMGINDDWNEGILMTSLGDNKYTYTLPKLTAGNTLNYNYRRGSSFENETPDTRSYSVINGDNVINDVFGIFTSTEDALEAKVKIYPNPSEDGILNIEGFEKQKIISIYNSIGGKLQEINVHGRKLITVDLSDLPAGMYFLATQADTNTTLKTYKILIY
jgi:hypothetical protein